MAAHPPDLSNPPLPAPIFVHLLPAHVEPEAFAGGTVVIIDQLRASTTICAALAAGATRVVTVLEPEHAAEIKAKAAPNAVVTGGERGGLLIPGFDLDNSPRAYTPERVDGKIIAFTTTNGTRAVEHAARAERIVIGCLGNLSALAEELRGDARPVHVLCAGTRGRITLEDVLCAGAMTDRLSSGAAGRPLNQPDAREDDDSALLARELWRSRGGSEVGILTAMRESRGGRNLARIGLHEDVEFCARIDVLPVVPEWDAGVKGFVVRG